MMKNILSILVAVLYFALSTGTMVSVHTCHGHITSIKLNSENIGCYHPDELSNAFCSKDHDTNIACCLDDKHHENCCSNQQINFKLDIEEQLASIGYKISFNLYTSENSLFFIKEDDNPGLKHNSYIELPPPQKIPLYLLHNSFAIYG